MKTTDFIAECRKTCLSVFRVTRLLPFIVLMLALVQQGFATDYYFSSSSGNDSRSAIEAQNSATPWKSIDKLNSISSLLKGGDRIFFKSGDVFYGTIKITKSGSAGAPILFTSYGTGSKPVITSLVKLTNLVSVGGGKYEADLSAFNISRLQIATVNDQIKEVGRYPNTGAADGGYLRITNVNSSTSISTPGNPYSGNSGDVVIRKNNWIIDRHAISSISGSSISFKSNESHYSPQKNYGYFLQNHASLLDMPGEWSYDPSTKKFTINLNGFNASSVNVSVATQDYLVTNNQYTTNLSFANLHFKGANSHLMNISRSENVKIENCLLEYAGENAIQSSDIRGYVVQNNQINYALNSGIYISYGAPGAIIRGNRLTNTFPFQGMAKNSDLAGIGIFLASDGDGSLIEKNTLINSGFNGIHFGGSHTKVVNNFIDNFCLYKQDGGGIYTNSDGFRDRNNVGREITGNIVVNGKGTKLGTTEEVDMAEGIYLDDNSAGVTVSKNTIAFVTGKGIYLHNANNITITDNLFYKSKSQLQLTHDFMGDPIRNINVNKNQFSSVEKTDQVYSIYSSENDIGSVGSFSSNYFLDPFKNDFFILTKGSNDGPTGVSRNLSNWATNFGYDANSLRPDLNVPTYTVTSSTLLKESDFSSNSSIVSGVYGASSQLVSGAISGGTLRLAPNSSNNATAYLQIGAVQAGQKIMIEFDMKGNPANIPVELFLEGTYNVDKGLSNAKVSTTTSAKSHKIILNSLAAKSNESVVFRFPPSLSELFLDNIKISRVTTQDIDKESLVFFAYNETGSPVQKSLSGTYVNAKNETFSSSISIPAYGSVLLAKVSGATTPVENKAPTVSLSKPTEGQVFIKGVNPVELVANAQDPEGKIKRVEFYNGTTLLTTVTAAPYSYTWSSIQNGTYQVYAKVVDEENLTATSTKVNFTVKEEEVVTPPSFTPQMVTPINNSTIDLGTQQVVLKTNAASSGLTIQKVEFFNWGYPLVTVTSGNFEFPWTKVEPDNYSINAKITDSKGNVYTTSTVKFTVKAASAVTAPAENKAPTVSLSKPTEGQVFTKGVNTVELVANAQDPEGKIKRVEFYNGSTLLATVTAAPYSYTWSSIQTGSYQVYAKVVDEGNLTASSTKVNFTVKDATVVSPPSYTAQMVSPANNTTLDLGSQQVVLKTNAASSGLTIQKVEYFNWGYPLVTVTSGNFEFPWTKVQPDNYSIYAKVTDSKGTVYTTATVKFTVKAASSTSTATPPVSLGINMSLPSDGQTFTLGQQVVKLKADVSGSTSIKNVQFYNWGHPLVAVNASPYEFDWTKIEVGDYQIYAVVTDQNGATSTSNTVKFKVTAPSYSASATDASKSTAPATLTMASPVDNQVFELGKDQVVLKAVTSESVSKVEFFNWYLPLVSVSNTNQFSWTKIELGEYFVSARITDSKGNVIDSEPVRFKVVSPNYRTNGETETTTPSNPLDSSAGQVESEMAVAETDGATGYGIKMGPNPTSSTLNVFFDGYPANMDGKVTVLDLRGVNHFNSDFNTDQESIALDLSFLKPGIYVVKLAFGDKHFQTKKLIKI
ncbi:right-handed parallel beta-helix repeat-containing protein [Algoriphagus sp. H41]|uniref:Right-handed parallel beta-helix repeat-containing protein n=1 Tax=Algoriphagus oliviformis TaxID=2811231 RepID=A0ABS3C0X5_9BACT|nr:Ig-like domain-containing protein [Algoriphagus oliviformis]MBN7810772.1 right-handed parallel beta-helix repeat-containing protein [Algoriphagus oliviformis]